MAKKKNIIIVGSGSLGAALNKELVSSDHNITVIDQHESAFRAMGRSFGGTFVTGDATNVETLIRAGISRCDILVAATSNDNTNVFAALVAKEVYKVKNVIARLYDEEKAVCFGEDIALICPSKLSAIALTQQIKDSL